MVKSKSNSIEERLSVVESLYAATETDLMSIDTDLRALKVLVAKLERQNRAKRKRKRKK